MSETATAPPVAPAAPAAAPDASTAKHGNNDLQRVQDKIIPKKTHWEDTIWKGPIEFVTKQSGNLTHDLGNALDKVHHAAGDVVHSASDSIPRGGTGFNIIKLGSEGWRSSAIKKENFDHIRKWLKDSHLADEEYVKGLEKAQVDGAGLVALHEIWAVDKLGFLKYAQESLNITTPGRALRFGIKLEELPTYHWEVEAATGKGGSKDAAPGV